jgi:hypothetical protein
MLTKVELTDRTKLVYVLNRNAEGKLFPSSPLEAHKNHALVTNIIGVDQVSCVSPIIFGKADYGRVTIIPCMLLLRWIIPIRIRIPQGKHSSRLRRLVSSIAWVVLS